MNVDSRRPNVLPWLPLILVLSALGLRWMKLESPGMTFLPNFAPWMALAFTGTLVFPRNLSWWVWPLLLLGVDFAAQGAGLWSLADERWEVFTTYALYAGAAVLAYQWREKVSMLRTLLGVAGCGVAFYLITNSLCWWVKPYYSKDLAGYVQSLTTGLPGFPPTWTFLRNSLVSDLGFSMVLLLAYNVEARVRNLGGIPVLTRTPVAA